MADPLQINVHAAGESPKQGRRGARQSFVTTTFRTSRSSFRVTAVAWAAGIAIVGVLAGQSQAANPSDRRHVVQDQISTVKASIADARERERALQAAIAQQSSRINGVQQRVDVLQSEVGRLEQRLASARAALQATATQLEKIRIYRAFLQRQKRIATSRLEQRAVALYTSDQASPLEVILGAADLGQAIDQLDFAARLADQDAILVGQVVSARRKTDRARASMLVLRRRQASLAVTARRAFTSRKNVLDSLVGERDRLAALRARRFRTLAAVQVDRSRWEGEAAALAAESERLAEIINAARVRQQAPRSPAQPAESGDQHIATPSSAGTSGSGLAWPLQGTIVSPFGQRWGRLHSGIDIAAPAGTPISASADGTVVYAGSMSGYGLIVVIQHADGLATAYAHDSSIAVGVGQTVSKGQVIAAVGCTGHCFGDHVHFEVRVGGSPVDPMGRL